MMVVPPSVHVLLNPSHDPAQPAVAMALSSSDLAEVVSAVLRQNRSHRLGWLLGRAAEALGGTDLIASNGDRWKWTGRSWVEVL